MGKVGSFRGEWQLTNPQMVLFGADGEGSEDLAALSLEAIGPLYPIYPLTKDVESWDIQKAISFARTMIDEVPDQLPESVLDQYDVLDARTALDLIHAPETWAGPARPAPLPFRGGARHPTCARSSAPRRARHGRDPAQRRPALCCGFDARLPFVLTGGPARGR